MGELQGNAAGIGVVHPNHDSPGAEGRNESIDPHLGDDHAVDDANCGADRDDDQHRDWDWELIELNSPTSNSPQKLAT